MLKSAFKVFQRSSVSHKEQKLEKSKLSRKERILSRSVLFESKELSGSEGFAIEGCELMEIAKEIRR